MSAEPVVVGIDLGGTKIAAARVARDGVVGEIREAPSPSAQGPDAVLDAVSDLVHATVRGESLAAVGVGSAGVIDVARGVVVSATETFRGWKGTDIRAGLRSRIEAIARPGPAQVFVENDVDAHAAGEAWVGAGRGVNCMLFIAVGTGVGGAILINGATLRGAHHVAGEIGHLPIPDALGMRCTCGRPGHLEAVASGPSIFRRYLELGGSEQVAGAHELAGLADAGDPLALRVLTEGGSAIGRAIAAIATVVDPDLVVLGGGVARSGERWWQAMEATLRAEVVDALAPLPVRRTQLGSGAAVIGAARGAWSLLDEGSP